MKIKYIIQFTLLSLVLSACEKADLTYPVALFTTATEVRPLYKFTLDASASFAGEQGEYLEYRWDLNGDHAEWDTEWLISPRLTIPYPFGGSGIMGLQVRSNSGQLMEIYREIWPITSSYYDYYVYTAYSDLSPGFRVISYPALELTEEYVLSLSWAYDNIVQSSSDSVYNFEDSYKQATYGSLMTWEKALHLDRHYKLPTVEEWQHMFDFSCGIELAGYNMQVEVEHGLNLNCPGMYSDGVLSEFEESGYYWTGDQASESTAYAVKITPYRDEAEIVELPKTAMASVRIMAEHYQYFE